MTHLDLKKKTQPRFLLRDGRLNLFVLGVAICCDNRQKAYIQTTQAIIQSAMTKMLKIVAELASYRITYIYIVEDDKPLSYQTPQ